jgi:hypothetical protein
VRVFSSSNQAKKEVMSFLSGIGNLLQQVTSGNANPEEHFDKVAQAVPSSDLASGLSAAFRSSETAPFSQMVSQMFSRGNGNQQASVLNTLLGSLGPGVLGGSLASTLGAGQSTVTPEQASQVDPAEVQRLAEHAEKQDPSIVDQLSQVYAQHPTLVKSLGAAALGIAMKRIAETHSA